VSLPVVHWEISAQDPKKAQEFYAKLFDWNVDANNPMNYGLVQADGNGGIGGGIGPANGHSGVTFYVGVDDLDTYLKRAESLGGKTVMPPTEIPGMVTLAQFTDPEGNLIGLVKNQMP
jgi:predicted enzyme related to lactoylglutathione lyase